MDAKPTSLFGVVKKTATEFIGDECPMMAAAVAYYTAFSLPPLLVLVVTIAGRIWSPEAVTGEIRAQVSDVVGEGGWQQIETMMHAAGEQDRGGPVAIIGIVILMFGATAVMVQLQAALNRAWGVQPDPDRGGVRNFLTKRMLSLAMIVAVAFLLLVSLVLTAILNAIGSMIAFWSPWGIGSWVPEAIHFLVSLLLFTVLFAAMFKWLPDARVRWRFTWIGACVTSVLFMAGKLALGMYFSMTDNATYGAAASFVLLLLWVYYSGMIFLFGAEFTQVWSQYRGSGIVAANGAVRVVETTHRIDQPSPAKP